MRHFKFTLKLPPISLQVFVRTWGCSHNNSDSEYMAGLLATYGE